MQLEQRFDVSFRMESQPKQTLKPGWKSWKITGMVSKFDAELTDILPNDIFPNMKTGHFRYEKLGCWISLEYI